MSTVEAHAYTIFDTPRVLLFLHVEHDNIAAVQFYKNLGYSIVDEEEDTAMRKTSNVEGIISIPITSNSNQHLTINTNQLAINTGTVGQLLMMKQLYEPILNKEVNSSPAARSSESKAGGFGKKPCAKQARKKKKRK